MDQEKKLEQEFDQLQNLAKDNKKIDVASLMLSALESQNQNLVSKKLRRWAYLISLGLPPLGLLFAIKFYFSTEDDAKRVAKICIFLTIVSLLLLWLFSKMFFSSTINNLNINQIQQLQNQDLQNLIGN